MDKRIINEDVKFLSQGILALNSEEEFYNFFEDLCTVSEIHSLAQRFAVAKLLKQGKTYQEAAEITGASTATISRISKCLNYGANGYATVLSRLNVAEDMVK